MHDEAVQRIECRSFSGHVYDMLDVWRKYESMDRGIGTTIQKKYLSRRTSFYEVVQQLIGSKASYVQQLAKAGSLLMYHGEQSDFLISRTLTKSTQSEMITSDSESREDEDCSITGFAQQNIFLDMVHVALGTRQDVYLNYCVTAWGYQCNRIIKLQKKAIRTVMISSYNAHTE